MAPAVGGIGYGGAFALGLVSGLVAAPCTGPVLTMIILWIGKTQNVALGAVAGAMFSIGLGIPFWLVGTFAVSLPKGGKWMLGVKSFFAIVMLVVALYFLKTSFPVLATFARTRRCSSASWRVLAQGSRSAPCTSPGTTAAPS
jgi:thiol:disulfide interchange protein DsbD